MGGNYIFLKSSQIISSYVVNIGRTNRAPTFFWSGVSGGICSTSSLNCLRVHTIAGREAEAAGALADMTLLWWKMNFISCHIQNSLLLCGRSESGKRNSLSSFGSWSEWAREWAGIHFSGHPAAVAQISIQTCAHRQARTDARRHGSLHLDCPLQGNSDSSLSRKIKKIRTCVRQKTGRHFCRRKIFDVTQPRWPAEALQGRSLLDPSGPRAFITPGRVWSVTWMKKHAERWKK